MKRIIWATAIALLAISGCSYGEKHGGTKHVSTETHKEGTAMHKMHDNTMTMEKCHEHMKDGKMMDHMPEDMAKQCKEMMEKRDMMKEGQEQMGDKQVGEKMQSPASPKKPEASSQTDQGKSASQY